VAATSAPVLAIMLGKLAMAVMSSSLSSLHISRAASFSKAIEATLTAADSRNAARPLA